MHFKFFCWPFVPYSNLNFDIALGNRGSKFYQGIHCHSTKLVLTITQIIIVNKKNLPMTMVSVIIIMNKKTFFSHRVLKTWIKEFQKGNVLPLMQRDYSLCVHHHNFHIHSLILLCPRRQQMIGTKKKYVEGKIEIKKKKFIWKKSFMMMLLPWE